jgi:hypothetical protein
MLLILVFFMIFTLQEFFCGQRKVAVLTMWLPNHYTERSVTAKVTDDGPTLTIETVPPKRFLDPVILSATSIAAANSRDNLGESCGVY